MTSAGRHRSGRDPGGREQALALVRSVPVTLPPQRDRMPAVLVFVLLAGLVAMHGLSRATPAGPTHQPMPVAVVSMDMTGLSVANSAQPADPTPDGSHHGPAAIGHHPCVAAPVAAVAVPAPADTMAAPLALPRSTAGSPPARARADRAPPDLNDLGISRT